MIPIETPSGEIRLAELVDSHTEATIASVEQIYHVVVDGVRLRVHEDDVASLTNAEDVVDPTRRAPRQAPMTTAD
ncbi:hypothetical protein [Halomarina rubra]|uniref:Halobacterial output domain-containing protein n=1 Tax=Halomarina rubra TaxID=2071873 RepID=A0ABD6ARD7_9EURY|nr:hypothetical protein [Halomarina rubra]